MNARVGHERSIDAGVVAVTPVGDFDAIAAEWDALAERSGSIFSTALWSRLWWAHFGEGRELLLHAARAGDGSLAVVLPLYAWRRRLPRVVRFLGHGPGDELGPVHARGARDAAASALRSALDALDWDVFLGEQLPGDADWAELVEGEPWRREASPSLALPTSWEEYLAGRSSNFREQLRRREAALAKTGEVVLRRAGPETLDRDLDVLFELHRARWGATPSDFGDSPFHRALARDALERGWLRLWLLELDGRPIAAWHGFQVGTVCSYYQAGRNPLVRALLGRIRPHGPLDSLRDRRRRKGVPPRAGRRGVQVPLHERRRRARIRGADAGSRRRGRGCGRASRPLRAQPHPLGLTTPSRESERPGRSVGFHPIG